MTEKEINQKLNDIAKDLKLFDTIIDQDYETGEGKLTEKQVQLVKQLFDLFLTLRWQLSFNAYKELKYDGSRKPIDIRRGGYAVKIRPCGKKYNNKTYFGIYIGDVALSISHSIKDNVVTAKHSMYNPAIFVPELNEIIYGCESWWGKITSKEDLDKLITNETIENVWYVKMLKEIIND
jgi:hypothetical protein